MKNHIQLKSITEENLSALWSISYGPKADLEWKKWDGPYPNLGRIQKWIWQKLFK